MRVLLAFVLLLAAGIGLAGYALGWFTFSTSPNEDKKDITLTVNPEKMKKDRDSVVGLFHSAPKDDKDNTEPAITREQKERGDFQRKAETRLQAMDLSLDELKAKAKNGRAVTKEQMNQVIADLNTHTEAAHEQMRDLKNALPERSEALKMRLNTSLDELEQGFEKAFSRFMNEWANSGEERKPR